MRWGHRNAGRRFGDRRVVKRFALVPLCIDEQMVWLEPYWVTQSFMPADDHGGDAWADKSYSLTPPPS